MIEQLRDKIEQIDATLIEKLAERQTLSKQIGLLKREQGKAVTDRLQEKKMFDHYDVLSEKHHLPRVFVRGLFRLIIGYSKKMQNDLALK